MAEERNSNTQNTRTTLSRSQIIERNTERKKRVIEQNVNAAVFVSDSRAGTQIFSSLRMIDSLDSAIRRLWGDKLKMSDVEKRFEGLKEVQSKLEALEEYGVGLLVQAASPRDISNRILRNIVADKIEVAKKAEKVDNPPDTTKTEEKTTTKKK